LRKTLGPRFEHFLKRSLSSFRISGKFPALQERKDPGDSVFGGKGDQKGGFGARFPPRFAVQPTGSVQGHHQPRNFGKEGLSYDEAIQAVLE
jgi:hypothetical protein